MDFPLRTENLMLKRAAALLACLLITAPALAWGTDGHYILTWIAEQRLTPEARRQVQQLLGDESMIKASLWADRIKDQRPETRTWHYINVPRGTRRVDREKHSPDTGSVLTCIHQSTAVLRNPDASHAARAEALRFLIHMVGDVHTPLHVSHAEDRGGNTITVFYRGEQTNLHALWDSGLIRGRSSDWSTQASILQRRITDAKAKAWSTSNPDRWATESYHVAVELAYKARPDRRISRAYERAALEAIDQRLMMAGVRLAALLNHISSSPTTQPK